MADHLTKIGAPSVVVVALDLSGPIHTAGPVLGLLAALLRGEEPHDAEVHTLGAIPASAVIDVWQPGNADY